MPNLTLEEQETHLSMTGDDRKTWYIYSDDPVMQRRLEAAGAEMVKEEENGCGGKSYIMPASRVKFRKPPTQDQIDRGRALAANRARQLKR